MTATHMNNNEQLLFVVSIHLTPQQEALAKALVACGYYGNLSEVGRAAIDRFVSELPPARKREVALHLYREGLATVSRFAEIADLPFAEARKLLIAEGVLQSGRGASADEYRRRGKDAANRYRRTE